MCADFMYQRVCWFLHRHASMLTCHCNAYDACLWRWKLAFSVVVSLIGGDDTDCKSCWSEYNGFVLQWLWYHIIASACSEIHSWCTKPQLHSSLRCLSPTHAECVMSGAWVRLRQILYGVGGLVSLWVLVLCRSSLQCFCWLAEWPAGSPLLVSCHLS